MVTNGMLPAAKEEMKYFIQKPPTDVRTDKKQGVEFPGHNVLKAAIQRHPPMLSQNHMSGCLPSSNATTKISQTQWRCNGTDTPRPDRQGVHTAEPTPPQPGERCSSTSVTSGPPRPQIVNLQARYMHLHKAGPFEEFFDRDAVTQDSQHDTDFDPHMITCE